jgi:hypothetical protein
MPEPFNWNVVVIGAWNLAILSPDGIRRRLFALPDPANIELEMAVDRPGIFRVGHEGLLVAPTPVGLEVSTRVPNAESLARACTLCQRALRTLPETPVSAAGVNIRYKFAEVPDHLFDLMHAPVDETLSDAEFRVTATVVKKTVAFPPGVVNVQMQYEGAAGTLEFNFHRDGTVPNDLSEWLGRVEEFQGLSDRLLALMGVENVRREVNA